MWRELRTVSSTATDASLWGAAMAAGWSGLSQLGPQGSNTAAGAVGRAAVLTPWRVVALGGFAAGGDAWRLGAQGAGAGRGGGDGGGGGARARGRAGQGGRMLQEAWVLDPVTRRWAELGIDGAAGDHAAQAVASLGLGSSAGGQQAASHPAEQRHRAAATAWWSSALQQEPRGPVGAGASAVAADSLPVREVLGAAAAGAAGAADAAASAAAARAAAARAAMAAAAAAGSTAAKGRSGGRPYGRYHSAAVLVGHEGSLTRERGVNAPRLLLFGGDDGGACLLACLLLLAPLDFFCSRLRSEVVCLPPLL